MEVLIFLFGMLKKWREIDISGKLLKVLVSTELQAQWTESTGLRGDSNGSLHLGTPANGNLRVTHFIAVFMGVPNLRTA